ncbi:hypothetical protein Glove_308g3 [Diversispora epigaea]|uniref:Uncharacterized protein n=1 Tax=Diversispora epigaea TaxID=1348612 RepID=A0A397HTZ0_9GLOM|nr:hypothetical protein Glove_308g5 [Diversispora epigaea]RHZ66309.1 hypothetical protein Glove_308g3 [Diversispora epigaea]
MGNHEVVIFCVRCIYLSTKNYISTSDPNTKPNSYQRLQKLERDILSLQNDNARIQNESEWRNEARSIEFFRSNILNIINFCEWACGVQ